MICCWCRAAEISILSLQNPALVSLAFLKVREAQRSNVLLSPDWEVPVFPVCQNPKLDTVETETRLVSTDTRLIKDTCN